MDRGRLGGSIEYEYVDEYKRDIVGWTNKDRRRDDESQKGRVRKIHTHLYYKNEQNETCE